MLLTAAQILAARDKKTVEVAVPEWGEGASVLVGIMGALEYAEFQDWLRHCGRPPEAPAEADESADKPIRVFTTDSPGGEPEPLDAEAAGPEEADDDESPARQYSFRDHAELMIRWALYCVLDPETQERAFTLDQLEALGAKSPAALQRICAVAMELHYGTESAVADFEKNSDGTPDGDSGGG